MTTYKTVTSSALERALLEDRSVLCQNSNAFQFPAYKVGAYKADGTAALADATNSNLRKIVGVSYSPISSGQKGYFVQRGIISEALSGLGAQPGDSIYLGLVAGSMSLTPPMGTGVAQILIGYASVNSETGTAIDLRLALDTGSGTSSGGGGSSSPEDQVQNGELVTAPALSAVCWNDDGQFILGNASLASKSDVLGILKTSTASLSYGTIIKSGRVANACASLGANPGQTVFLSDTVSGGLTLNAPSNIAHSIVRIGYAIPPNGNSGAATDLDLDIEILFLP